MSNLYRDYKVTAQISLDQTIPSTTLTIDDENHSPFPDVACLAEVTITNTGAAMITACTFKSSMFEICIPLDVAEHLGELIEAIDQFGKMNH